MMERSKTILFISFYMYPSASSGAKRIANFTSALPEYGWRTIVVSGSPGCFCPVDNHLMSKLSPSVELSRVPCGSLCNHLHNWRMRNRLGILGKIARPFGLYERWMLYRAFPNGGSSWQKKVVPAVRQMMRTRKIDVIWVTTPPFITVSLVSLLSRFVSVPIILDIRDSWTLPEKRRIKEFPGKYMKEAREQELQALRSAAACVFNSGKAMRMYKRHYRMFPESFWHMIPNGFGSELMDITPLEHPCFTLVHIGQLSGSRSSRPLLASLRRLADRKIMHENDVQFLNIGITQRSDKKMILQRGLSNIVEILGFLPHERCVRLAKGAHLLVLFVGAEHSANVPGKIFEYFALGRPILCIGPDGSEAGELIRKTKSGVVCAFDDESSIDSAIGEAYNNWKAGAKLEGPDWDEVNKFSVPFLLKDVIELLERVTRQSRF